MQAAKDGYTIKYVVADTGSTPTGALAAAQKLVDQDHVFAVLAYSGATFGAEPFLKSKGIPVIGVNIDATEWATAPNMFSVGGTSDYTKVFTQTGLQFKGLGATNIACDRLLRVSELLGYGQIERCLSPAGGPQGRLSQRQLPLGWHQRRHPPCSP